MFIYSIVSRLLSFVTINFSSTK